VKIIERNDAVIEQLAKQTKDFWNNFIIPRIAPSPDGSISSGQTIKRMYPEEEAGKIIDITNMENQSKMERLEIIKGQAKELKKEVNFIKQEFQVQMGDAEQAICSDKLINWKSQHKKSYVVQESDSRVMRIGKYKVNGGK
jgi:predicted phage-related endonuclease